jgi:hypothetical protein
MQVKKNDYDSVYSWNNLNLRGKLFGQGIVYLERFDKKYSKNEYKHTTFSTDGRKRLQFGFLNRFTTLLMCYGYYYSGFISSHSEYINILQASFPINGKEIYYHLFGREGLREYQLIIPEKNFENFILELRKAIIQYKIPMTLGSLKLFKGTKRYLNFCRDGICLALDVPNNKRSVSFFSGLDDLTKKYNGIANLSKDSRLNGETLSGMYREYDLLKEDLFKFDPEKHFTSALRERIGI